MAKAKLSPKRLMLVHAHPDDESLFTGHLIAKTLESGGEVYLLTLTRGERGKMKLQELRSLQGNLAAMGAFRANELAEAVKAYGGFKHEFAGSRSYLDSGVRLNVFGKAVKRHRLDEMSLAAASTAVIAQDILVKLEQFQPDTVVTYNRKGGFGHPDHKKAHEATAMAIRKYAKSNRGKAPQFLVIAEPGERFDFKVGDEKSAQQKKSALEAHASQVAVGRETYSLVPAKELRYDEPERFRRASTSPWLGFKTLLAALWALPLGVLVALAGTLLHQVRASTLDRFPVGLVIALVTIAALALALRLLRNSRGALYLMSLSFAGTIFWLSQQQPGGEIFIVADDIGNFWSYGSIAICAAVILFPKLRPGSWNKHASGHR